MKLGIIRCEETAKMCAGWNCFPAMRDRTGTFEAYDSIQVVGFDTCGGCGKGKADKIVSKAKELKKQGSEVIHLGNCLAKGCPWRTKYAKTLRKEGLNIIEGTHPSATPEQQERFRRLMQERKREEKRKRKVLEAAGFVLDD